MYLYHLSHRVCGGVGSQNAGAGGGRGAVGVAGTLFIGEFKGIKAQGREKQGQKVNYLVRTF